MKESVIQHPEEDTPLRIANNSNYVPPVLRNWPPEREFVMPQVKPVKRPLFLMSFLMFTITAFVYVKFYM